jgi:replication-associated recombination protein RarA
MTDLWYRQLGFKENPFSIKPAVFGNKLVGYDHIINELWYRIDAGGMVFLEGSLGSGKTSLLKLIEDKYRGLQRVWYFSCNQIKEDDIGDLLLSRVGFWQRVFGIKPKGMIVLLDEVEELSSDSVEKIKFLFDEDTVKSVVFTGVSYSQVEFSESVKERINRSVIRLDTLKPEEAVHVVRNRVRDNPILNDDMIKDVFKVSKANPRKLLYNCEHVCRYAVLHNAPTVTKEHIAMVAKGQTVLVKRDDKPHVTALEKRIKQQVESLQHLQHDLLSIRGTSERPPLHKQKKGMVNRVVDYFDEPR